MGSYHSFARLGLMAGFFALSAGFVHADVLVNQQPDIFPGGFASQRFTDIPYDILSFDDFNVGSSGFTISKVTIYGGEFGDATQNVGVRLALTSAPTPTAIGATYSGIEDGHGNLVFTEPITLTAGHYYLSGFVERPINDGGGQWYWRESAPVTGDGLHSHIYYRDGSNDIDLSRSDFDLAFTIEGSNGIASPVPEPSSTAAFVIGALGLGALALRRRRSAA